MYIVPKLKLIPQDQNMACWYASAQMLISWRRNKTQMSEMGILNPSEVATLKKLYNDNSGINNAQVVQLGIRIGLKPVPPMCPTEDAIESWLRTYGPLWVNGTSHIVVIGGVSKGKLLVYDPWPPNKGTIEWRSTSWLTIGGKASTLDVNGSLAFLRLP